MLASAFLVSAFFAACQNTGPTEVPVDVNAQFGVGNGGAPDRSRGPFAYVAVRGSSLLMVVETETNTVVDTVKMRFGAWGVASRPDGAFVYVTHEGFNRVSVIETEFNTVVAEVNVGQAGTIPLGIVTSPDGAFAYTANFGRDFPNTPASVSVISTATNEVVAKVEGLGRGPTDVAITPDGAFLYVTNAKQGANSVSVISTATNEVVATVSVPRWPQRVAITPNGAFAYVTNLLSNSVSVIDTGSNTVVQDVLVSGWQRGVAITPDGAFVYVANRGSNRVSVIATATNTQVATVEDVGIRPESVEISPDGAFAYVATASGVTVVATATNEIVARVPVANGPNDIAFTALLPASPSVTALTEQVQDLIEAGLLAKGGNGLLGMLGQVLTSVQNRRPSAVERLNSFINAVEGAVNGGRLTADQGQALISAAQSIIDKLEPPPPPPPCDPNLPPGCGGGA